MKTAICHLVGISPYSPSRPFESEMARGEKHEAFDERCWREHAHIDNKGEIIIPFMGFKYALDDASKLTQRKMKGNQTYSKTMSTGVIMDQPLALGIKRDALTIEDSIRIYANADGKRGSGTRVWRRYPQIAPWKGKLRCTLINPAIDEGIFEEYIREAGLYIGVGRFRPAGSGGVNGRWSVEKVEWSDA